MPGTDLFPDETDFTPRPAWQVIEAARRQYLTGELTLHTAPTTRVYMRDGMVYYAERSTDGTLAVRLMMEGVITREQMQRGTVIVNGVEHVGRMFDVDPTIDRSSVELCAELFADDVMVDVSNRLVKGYELVLYRRHPSGIDRWYAHSVPVVGRHNEPTAEPERVSAPEPIIESISAPEPIAAPEVVAEVIQAERSTPEVHSELAAPSEPQARTEPEAPSEPRNKLNAPPITLAVPVTRAVGIGSPPPPVATQPIPVTPLVTMQLPVVSPATTAPPPQVATPPVAPASDDVDASTIADEVAEAIKRAFAGMGAGH
ncbi:MAG TPA: hypothetical protein VHN36_14295 [Ilumatobacteraceae bacterium]|nr:hypothetical protein [Ilumatobacteraceae bacterium]